MFEKFSFLPFLAVKEVLASLANDPIMSGKLIWLFGHLEHQNLSLKVIFSFFLATREGVASLSNDPIIFGYSI